MKEHITHQDIKPFIPKDAKFLILGSLPSVKSREQGFYYAHPQNRFFKVLSSIFNTQEPASIEDRKAFLKKYKIGLYDVVFECDIDNSDDSTISNVKIINLFLTYNLCVCVLFKKAFLPTVEYTFSYISFSYFLEF